VGASGVDTFDDLPPGERGAPLARAAGPFGYTVSASTTGLFVVDGADRALSTNTATDLLTFAGFGPQVRGVGAFLFGTDLAGLLLPGTTLTVRATSLDGTSVRTVVAPSTGTGTFLGFVASTGVLSFTVQATQPPDGFAWPTVDGLVLAEARTTSVVPEPAPVTLLGAGLAVVGAVLRRRRHA
jgi:hypothetical protein